MISYDRSLSVMIAVIVRQFGASALLNGRVLRDARGQLTFLLAAEVSSEEKGAAELSLQRDLGVYARPDRALATPSDPGIADLLRERASQWYPSEWGPVPALDRRIVGADWLAHPNSNTTAVPPRFAFTSLKGGVGRTTALCVAAVELAREGKNVLVVDLDLEAPGAGSMLLPPGVDAQPRLGVLDYLVETSLRHDAAAVTADMVAPCPFVGGSGQVDVVPVIGREGEPVHYLGKLARAVLDLGPDGTTFPLRTKVARMVDALCARATYDLVLIDVRAGLAEVSAGPILGLGANILLFGTAQRQTLDGLTMLFAHLATLVPPGDPSPWQDLRFIQAKTTGHEQAWFHDELYELFQSYLYEAQEGIEGFNFARNDPEAPHRPVPIAFHPDFTDWDPSRRPSDLSHSFYAQAFGPFLAWLRDMLE